MEIIIIIVAIILIVIAFFIGRSLASKPIKTNNDKLVKEEKDLQTSISVMRAELQEVIKLKEIEEAERKHELDKLDSKLSWKWQDIHNAEEKLKWIEKQYQDKLQVIENTEQLAKDAYDKNMQVYARKMLDEQARFDKTIQEHEEKIEQVKKELNSFKETKQAAIEAARKEKNIQENKDEYCLILPREEERDVSILREAEDRISKPRVAAMAIWNGYYQQTAKTKFPKILGKQDVCGIYKITNQKTGECYIGQAVDVRKRWYDHAKAGLGIDTPQGNKLYAAMKEYGLNDFSFELLEECSGSELNQKEKYFIELYQSNIIGYNGNSGVNT